MSDSGFAPDFSETDDWHSRYEQAVAAHQAAEEQNERLREALKTRKELQEQAEAEVTRLTSELDAAANANHMLANTVNDQARRLVDLNASLATLREQVGKLKGYAVHRSGCVWWTQGTCTCGLALLAALLQTEER